MESGHGLRNYIYIYKISNIIGGNMHENCHKFNLISALMAKRKCKSMVGTFSLASLFL